MTFKQCGHSYLKTLIVVLSTPILNFSGFYATRLWFGVLYFWRHKGVIQFYLSNNMETAMSVLVGIGLSAACGFRVFVPLLVVSLATMTGHLHLSPGFQWIGTFPALIAFGTASILEIGGYYIPWLDHALDVAATPAAIVAGTVISASMVTDISPFLKWTLAVVAGGGAAGMVQMSTVMARGTSLLGTGGMANPIVATGELAGSVLTSLMALFIPIVAVVLLTGMVGVTVLTFRKRAAAASAPTPSATHP
jgi:hypothetical protein